MSRKYKSGVLLSVDGLIVHRVCVERKGEASSVGGGESIAGRRRMGYSAGGRSQQGAVENVQKGIYERKLGGKAARKE